MTAMACIPVRDTRPERLAQAALRRVCDGPIITQAPLPGTPDLALPELRVAVCALGCFWHHHEGCPHARVPVTTYPWARKFSRIRARDLRCRAQLAGLGWRTLWIWECALVGRGALKADDLDQRIAGFIRGREHFLQIEGTEVLARGFVA